MNFFHLSHIDLDGYGCQFLTTNLKNNVQLFNCNYGQILDTLSEIKKEIKNNDFLLISDINLTLKEAEAVQSLSDEIGFEIKLLDHHGTGKDVAKIYDWYHLDETKCGTMLVFEYFNSPLEYKLFAEIVNSYDLWKENDKYFNLGKMLNEIISTYNYSFPQALKRDENFIILNTLNEIYTLFGEDLKVSEIEMKRYLIERTLFLDGKTDNPNLTFHEVKVDFLTDKIMEKELFEIISIDGYNTYVFTGLSKIFQQFSNNVLHSDRGIDIALNLSQRGTMSIRSNLDDIDLGQISLKYFNGGGHPKASGGSLGIKKGEYFDYPELIQMLKNKIKELS